MSMEFILPGESKNVEYKVTRPKDSKKYIKTVIAFANGSGGSIVFGIDDVTHEVKGVPKEILFEEMDAIANAVSDSCEPMIVPDISVQEVEGKTLIVVEVSPGMQRPYYLKTMGIQDGTFVRVAGTSRPVEPYMLKELMLEGSGRSMDGVVIDRSPVSDEEIEEICSAMTGYAQEQCEPEEKKQVRPLTKNQLLSWELLVEKDGRLYPTYGYNLLAGKEIPSAMTSIQCAVFKGKTRAVFVDRKEYDGPVYRQIDEAYHFVLRMIRMGAEINGIFRRDVYEFPVGTVREMICNAVCHRSWFQPAHVQVALYDDRLEVTSPGMLSRDVTIQKMKEGFSKIRNRGIAKAFSYMRIIEGWGSGIPRMLEECREYGLQEPELIDADGDFRINLYRRETIGALQLMEDSGKSAGECRRVPESAGECRRVPESANVLTEQQETIFEYIKEHGQITSADTERILNVKQRRARAILREMVKKDIIRKVGAAQKTRYILT